MPGRHVLLGRPKKGTGFAQGGQRRRARLALVKAHPHLVKRDAVLTDGEDKFRVAEELQPAVGPKVFYLVNELLPDNRGWFSIEDMGELAVVLDTPSPGLVTP